MKDPYSVSEVFFRLVEFSCLFEGIDMLFYGRGPLSSNVYILDGGKVLIDAGNSFEILRDLENHYGKTGVEKVIITHAHPDHIGALFSIVEAYKPAVYIHEIEAKASLYGNTIEDILKGTKVDYVLLRGNENIEVGGRIYRVLFAPGHTPGTIMLYDTERGILFSSDVVFPMLGSHILLTQPDPSCGDLNELILSVRYVMRLRPKAVLPGHLFPFWERTTDHIKRTYFELKFQEEGDRNLALISLGINLADMGELEEAISCFKLVLDDEPNHPGALFVLSLALLHKGNLEESYKKVCYLCELYPDFKEAQDLKSRIELLLNK
ncbi:MAG: MBL fold metallo-hydrolase [Thermosulfidibacteraceae bacterium]